MSLERYFTYLGSSSEDPPTAPIMPIGRQADYTGRYHTTPEAMSDCQLPCYQTKSLDYQKCRDIPADQRGARGVCFQAADKKLEACLSNCKGSSAGSRKTTLLIGAAAVAAWLILK